MVSCFVADKLDAEVLNILSRQGTKLIALRSAGFNNVDLATARQLGLIVRECLPTLLMQLRNLP